MDSKYASLGGGHEIKKLSNFKRKTHNVNINVKRRKLSDSKNQNVHEINGNSAQNLGNKMETQKKNLQEERRQLPVYIARGRLLEEMKKHNTMIVIGETGSGKTTQIPQLIHEQRLEGAGAIAVTQPRRVAAITIATRVAAEMSCDIGTIVGYSVRFEDVTSPGTKVKYLTDGMLLREAIGDPLLNKYSYIILDEAHERTVSTDVLFGIVKLAQKERNEKKINPLKLIIMSATMDVDTFRRYFDNCPVMYVEGRSHPVTIFHAKTVQEDYQYAALCTIFQLHATAPADHDFLVFLTGQEEIETVMYNIKQIAKEAAGPAMVVCPLYAGLPPGGQLRVWRAAPPRTRKVVLATNVAEASLTIPTIKCVIDCGLVKERTWWAATGAERLRVVPCARAAAGQRAGRAGRTAPGAVYRLYTARQHRRRPAHALPEIVRCPLAPTILSLIAAGIEPTTFPLIDAPPSEAIRASLTLLKDLGAIDSDTSPQLTALGHRMSSFPLDPKYSKVLLTAPHYQCLDEQWCKENFLNHKSLLYAAEVRRQLAAICRDMELPLVSCGDDTDQVVKCLLSGLWRQCAWWRGGDGGDGGGRYVTAGGHAALLHPASVLHAARPSPPALLYTDLLHTSRPYLATVSLLQPHWLHTLPPPPHHHHR